MSRVRRFEDLIAWQKARQLTKAIYDITRLGTFARDFGLSNQMQRAAVSIMSNIAEGFERTSTVDYQRFLVIAKSSCGELRSQLYVAFDVGHIDREHVDRLTEQAQEVSRLLAGLHSSLSRPKLETP